MWKGEVWNVAVGLNMKMGYDFGSQKQLFHWMFVPNLQFQGDLVYNTVHLYKGATKSPLLCPSFLKTHVLLTNKEKNKDMTSLVGALSAVVLCEHCLPLGNISTCCCHSIFMLLVKFRELFWHWHLLNCAICH